MVRPGGEWPERWLKLTFRLGCKPVSGPHPGGEPHSKYIYSIEKVVLRSHFSGRFHLQRWLEASSAVFKWPAPCLSDRIAQNRKTIVCPMIDVIDHDNFGYETQAGDAMRGAFDWEMYYKRIPIPLELQKEDPSEPFEWVQQLMTHLCVAYAGGPVGSLRICGTNVIRSEGGSTLPPVTLWEKQHFNISSTANMT